MEISRDIRALAIQAYDWASPESFLSVPLGIHRMGFHVEAEIPGVQFDFIDPNLHYPDGQKVVRDALAKGVDGKGPYDVVCFSPLHFTLEHDLSIMFDAQKLSPDSLFIAGGQQAAFADTQLYSNWDALDVVVVGEGEKPMTEIMKHVQLYGVDPIKKNPSLLADIPGMRFRDPEMPRRPNYPMTHEEFVEATNRLDFGPRMNTKAYWNWIEKYYTEEQLQDMELLRKIRVVKPYTTNFCPMQCSFCSTTQFYRDAGDGSAKVRGLRGAELGNYVRKILDTNEDALTVYFKDDLWFIRGITKGDEECPEGFMDEIANTGFPVRAPVRGTELALLQDLSALHAIRVDPKYADRGITYFGKARVDTFVNPKNLEVDHLLLGATKTAGFNSISFGVESFDVNELDHFNKRLGTNGPMVNRIALEACKQYSIHAVAYMILSSDISTPDSILTNVDEASILTHEGHTIKVNPWLYSLPGTELAKLNENSESLTKQFDIPGYPGKKVERIMKIFPEDQAALDLMSTYEERLPEFKQEWKKKLNREHWISELGTPVQFLLLLNLANEMKLNPINTNTKTAIDLDARIAMLQEDLMKNKHAEGKMLTYA